MPASYIPSGYRLLTADDAEKVWGVDLELNFYIDNTVTPNLSSPNSIFPAFFTHSDYGSDLFRYIEIGNSYISIMEDGYDFWATLYSSSSWSSSFDFTQPFVIHSESQGSSNLFNTYSSNNFIYVKDIQTATPKEEFISSMNSLGKSITDKAGASGKKSITELKDLVDNLKTTFTGQEKTVTPSKTSQVITADSGYDGLSKVTVNVIPSSYIIPSGTLAISENGTKDVTQYASVEVNIQPTYWDGTYEESDE